MVRTLHTTPTYVRSWGFAGTSRGGGGPILLITHIEQPESSNQLSMLPSGWGLC